MGLIDLNAALVFPGSDAEPTQEKSKSSYGRAVTRDHTFERGSLMGIPTGTNYPGFSTVTDSS